MLSVVKMLSIVNMFAIMGFIIGMPLFFTGCNFKYTNFCPRYRFPKYTGTVYYYGRHDPGFNKNNNNYIRKRILAGSAGPPGPTSGHPSNDDEKNSDNCVSTVVYAINKSTMEKCHIKFLSHRYHLGENINWYKFKNIGMYEGRDEFCEESSSVEERWMAGLIFLSISAASLFIMAIHTCCVNVTKPVDAE